MDLVIVFDPVGVMDYGQREIVYDFADESIASPPEPAQAIRNRMSLAHQEFAAGRIIVMSAPNGARLGAADHPAIPITPGQLARTAQSLLDETVAVLHLHVRDSAGEHTLDVAAYRDAIDAIRAQVGDALIVQVTTEAVGRYDTAEQMAVVRELKPEAVSLGLRELCPDDAAEKPAGAFFAWLRGEKIWPQYILYSPEDVARFDRMRRAGVFAEERPFCLFVLGRYTEQLAGDVAELHAMLAAADCREFPWAACCFGPQENLAMQVAAAHGGHVRIGFENNLRLADGSIAADNAALIAQFTGSLGMRRAATADEIRQAFFACG